MASRKGDLARLRGREAGYVAKGVALVPLLRQASVRLVILTISVSLFAYRAGADEIPPSLLNDTLSLNGSDEVASTDVVQQVRSEESGPIWVGGAETTFLAPIITGMTARTLIVDNSTSDGAGVIDDVGLEMMTCAPRVWFGVNNGEGWGLVTRFWYLNDIQLAQRSVDVGAMDFELQGENRLKQYTIDLEMTRNFEWGNWLMDASFGARYASIEYFAGAASAAQFGSTLATATAISERSFNGSGITFSLGGRRAWRPNSSMHWIWNARGSTIFGNARYAAFAGTEIFDGGSPQTDGDIDRTSFNDTLFIGEVQGGVQWEHRLQATPATAFFRVVCEYQYWGGVDNDNAEITVVTTTTDADVASAAYARGINLDLIGLAVGAGLTW
jgi:hypothetical protein